jgi:hypothetical protein
MRHPGTLGILNTVLQTPIRSTGCPPTVLYTPSRQAGKGCTARKPQKLRHFVPISPSRPAIRPLRTFSFTIRRQFYHLQPCFNSCSRSPGLPHSPSHPQTPLPPAVYSLNQVHLKNHLSNS